MLSQTCDTSSSFLPTLLLSLSMQKPWRVSESVQLSPFSLQCWFPPCPPHHHGKVFCKYLSLHFHLHVQHTRLLQHSPKPEGSMLCTPGFRAINPTEQALRQQQVLQEQHNSPALAQQTPVSSLAAFTHKNALPVHSSSQFMKDIQELNDSTLPSN